MATNITKSPTQFMEQQLKNAEIHLSAAHKRVKHAQEKLAQKKLDNPTKKKIQERPDIPDSNSEIRNLEIKIANIKYVLKCIKLMEERGLINEEIWNKYYGEVKDNKNFQMTFPPAPLAKDNKKKPNTKQPTRKYNNR